MWALGGHYSAFRWWLGAEGERETAAEIEKLGTDWYCEHDLEHDRGNWDHVLVGPPGVFLLDSKRLDNTAAAGGDALRSGRLAFHGGVFRYGAKRIKVALEERLGARAPWVQAVVVVWGDFPQARHEEQDVIYLRGEELRSWLSELPSRINAPQRAALVTGLRELRGVGFKAFARTETGE
jgi:Nuclease-related domain